MGFEAIGDMTRRLIEKLHLERQESARDGLDEGPDATAAPRAIPHGTVEGGKARTVGNGDHHAASFSATPMMSPGVSGTPRSRAAASKRR
jgi:hypothetical protein